MTSTTEQRVQSIWTTVPGLVERMLALAAQGIAYAQIAATLSAEFGLDINRNMVIGRARREGVKPRQVPTVRHKIAIVRRDAERARRRRIQDPSKPAPEPTSRVSNRPVTVVQLKVDDCRWIINEGVPVWLHCGQKKFPHGPYCAEHDRIAYNRGARR